MLDVTERVRARQEVEAQRAILRTIIEGSPLGLGLLDRDLRIIHLTRGGQRCPGLTIRQHEEKSCTTSYLYRYSGKPIDDRVMAGEAVNLFDIPYTHPEGGARYYDAYLHARARTGCRGYGHAGCCNRQHRSPW